MATDVKFSDIRFEDEDPGDCPEPEMLTAQEAAESYQKELEQVLKDLLAKEGINSLAMSETERDGYCDKLTDEIAAALKEAVDKTQQELPLVAQDEMGKGAFSD